MRTSRQELEEVEQTARAVFAGEDSIEIPLDLTRERPEEAAPKHDPPPSLFAQIADMTVAQKVKLAIQGNKDARTILLRGTNRLVQRMVLQNPRISEEEILMLAKSRNTDDELLRQIAENREWSAIPLVRSALVENAKTPIAQALRLLPLLGDREIRFLAKSKNVPHVIAAQARRILFQRNPTR